MLKKSSINPIKKKPIIVKNNVGFKKSFGKFVNNKIIRKIGIKKIPPIVGVFSLP